MSKFRYLLISIFIIAQVGLFGFSTQPDEALPLKSVADIIDMESVSFSFQNQGPEMSFTSSPARIFYSFHPAELFPERKPLFVFMNGGPGCPTSLGFLSANTGPFTLDKTHTQGKPVNENPYRWTRFGNLLYIDAPDTGFSYNLMDKPEDAKLRAAEFDAQNFNPFIDAAQHLRLLLRFLKENQAIQKNPVILVGESYAGTRISTMLNILLNYTQYGDGSRVYKDESLVKEIQEHFDAVYPDNAGKPFSAEAIAKQFGRQILVEPELTGVNQSQIMGEMFEQPDSIIYQIARQTGHKFISCKDGAPGLNGRACNPVANGQIFIYQANRDFYIYTKPLAWGDGIDEGMLKGLLTAPILSKVLQTDALSIKNLAPAARTAAFRFLIDREQDTKPSPDDLAPPFKGCGFLNLNINNSTVLAAPVQPGESLEYSLGPLTKQDDYFVSCNLAIYRTYFNNSAVKAGYAITPESPMFGEMFLHNLQYVETFMTDAALDLMIYSPSIAPSFLKYTSLVDSVKVSRGSKENRNGFINVVYKSGALPGEEGQAARMIYYPHYATSGHTVSLTQPEELTRDIQEWLNWVKPE